MGCHCNLNSCSWYFNNAFMDIQRENSTVIRKDVNGESVNSGKPQRDPFLTGAGLFPSVVIEINMGSYFMEVLINWRKCDGL